jgi:hypothetical protein
MMRPAGHVALRQRINPELRATILSYSQRTLADKLGLCSSTISRREASIEDWRAQEVLDLAVEHPELRAAIVAYLLGECPTATAIEKDLAGLVGSMGGAIQAAIADLADGRIDRDEAVRQAEGLSAIQEELGHIIAACRQRAER